MRNLYFIGFMGAGKTTVGRLVAKKAHLTFVDSDDAIVKNEGMAIPAIFEKYGEARFRDIETETLRKIAKGTDMVVSLGGGAVLRDENVKILKESGMIVMLSATPDTIYKRVGHDAGRPVLDGHRSPSGIEELLKKRLPAYESAADITVATDGLSVRDVADKVLSFLEKGDIF